MEVTGIITENSNLLGYTKSKKPIYSEFGANDYEGFDDKDHHDAVVLFSKYFLVVSSAYRLSEIGRKKWANYESHKYWKKKEWEETMLGKANSHKKRRL